jgi:TrwC relaxase
VVCSTRTGSVGTNAVAQDLAAYYAGEQTVASYYGRQDDIRADVSAAMSDRLGLDATRPAAQAKVASLMLGKRADGQEIKGRARRAANQDGTRERTAFVDFTWSASKTLSVAIALAKTPEERATQSAVADAMRYVGIPDGPCSTGQGREARHGSRRARLGQLRPLHQPAGRGRGGP